MRELTPEQLIHLDFMKAALTGLAPNWGRGCEKRCAEDACLMANAALAVFKENIERIEREKEQEEKRIRQMFRSGRCVHDLPSCEKCDWRFSRPDIYQRGLI